MHKTTQTKTKLRHNSTIYIISSKQMYSKDSHESQLIKQSSAKIEKSTNFKFIHMPRKKKKIVMDMGFQSG